MQNLYQNLEELPASCRNAVIAIGNFDGVHKGHQTLIQQAKDLAQAAGQPLGVLTFEPHPRAFFKSDQPSFRLTLLPEKTRLLQKAGAEFVVCLDFNQDLSALSAQMFIEDILIKGLGVSTVIVGDDFCFGQGRQGNIHTLEACPAFETQAVVPVPCPDGTPFSSSRIRAFLEEGALPDAEALLGHPWAMEGTVLHGDKRGRTMGFPTINQRFDDYVRLPFGVYVTHVCLQDTDVWLPSVSNYGIRPMYTVEAPLFETYIFDFDNEIYGQNVRVRPMKYLRPEMCFSTMDALKEQIQKDCQAARAALLQES